ncbi:MAG TPA: hypothetical protein VGM32_04325 [Rhodopila sp.]|jgi:Spy/CpxP family protein refolding chaperone
MKTKTIAAVAALSLGASSVGAGAAYAQSGPVGYQQPAYGAQAFSDHRNETAKHFLGQDTVLGKMFNHSNTSQLAAAATAKGG